MPFVLDASTALSILLEEAESAVTATAVAAMADGDTAHVPDLWLLEVANGLIVSERRKRIRAGSGEGLLSQLLALPIRLSGGARAREVDHARTVLALAREQRLSIYDATYLRLAVERGLALATLDAGLSRAAKNLSVPLLGS